MYRHDLRYFFCFYSVTFAELCVFSPHLAPPTPPLLCFFSSALSADAVRAPVRLRISTARIVSCQFLPNLFSIFMLLRNYSLMHVEHFALELFARNSMSIY